MYLGKHYKLKVIKGQKYNVKLSDKYLTLTIKSHTKDDKIKNIANVVWTQTEKDGLKAALIKAKN